MDVKGDPQVTKLPVHYFYAFEYEDIPTCGSALRTQMEVNAAIHAMADVCDMPELKKLAA